MIRFLILAAVLFLGVRPATAAEAAGAAVASGCATWEAAMTSAFSLAEAGKIDEIIDQRLSPVFIAKLKEQHGAEQWRAIIHKKLERLPYYYLRLEEIDKRHVVDKGDRVIVRGEYGCFAEFDKVDGVYRIGSFGQEVTSM